MSQTGPTTRAPRVVASLQPCIVTKIPGLCRKKMILLNFLRGSMNKWSVLQIVEVIVGLVLICVGLTGCPQPRSRIVPPSTPVSAPSSSPFNIVPTRGQVLQPRPSLPRPTAPSLNGIDYHNGPIIPTPQVYFIWYGNWTGNTALNILPDFITGLSGSPYFNIDTTYSDNTGQSVANSVSLKMQVFDNYSQGKNLTDQSLQTVITQQLQSGALPNDPNGVYFVLSSTDVDEQGASGGFCVNFCGFHNHFNFGGSDIKFAFVGNIDRCQPPPPATNPCAAANLGVGPNGNSGADAMANTIAHELNEAVTDPDLNAWFDAAGMEVGDKCNFQFGPEFPAPNGAPADITLGARNFLIQETWLNSGGGSCAISFGTLTGGDTVFSCRELCPNLNFCNGVGKLTTAGSRCFNQDAVDTGLRVPSPSPLPALGSTPVFRCNQFSQTLPLPYGIGEFTEDRNFCLNGDATDTGLRVAPGTPTPSVPGTVPVFRCNQFCNDLHHCYPQGALTSQRQFCANNDATDTGLRVQ